VPSPNGNEILKCPKSSKIYVLERTNKNYYKVRVQDTVGYLTNAFMNRK